MIELDGFVFPEPVLDYMAPGNRQLALDRAKRYPVRMAREWGTIAPYAKSADAILDIGCGLGGIDVMAARNLDLDTIILLDGDGDISKRGHLGFKDMQEAWADVNIARTFVNANIVHHKLAHITVMAWTAARFPMLNDIVDLIVSLRSWGHHYPVTNYAALAQRVLPRGGIAILDIRNGTDGLLRMQASGFRYVATCDRCAKCERVVLEKR